MWNPFRQQRADPPLFCEPDVSGGMQPFWDELARMMAWCEPRVNAADPRGCLRSQRLQPRVLESGYADAVRGVALLRGHRTQVHASTVLSGGRLLVYYPDADLADGGGELKSGGYLDVHNTPPWDTWVALVTDLSAHRNRQMQLISWVPDAFISGVQLGIEIHLDESLVWLDEADTRFARMVAAGQAAR